LRTHEENTKGFLEQVTITPEDQIKYMGKYSTNYLICLDGDTPVGFIGEIDNDIRLAVHPDHKRKGIGKFMLNEFMKIKPNALAKVLWTNDACIFLFKSAGFIQYDKDNEFIYFRKPTKDDVTYRRPMHNPFKVVRMFEEEVADYTGAPYAVSVDNCTNAIFLLCKYLDVKEVTIPSKTYLSVPQSIIHAGGTPIFDTREETNNWQGIYQLKPYPIYDAAKRFTSGMYIPNTFMCLSFHIKKQLKLGKGGMILTDSLEAVEWLKKARYEGRSEKLYHEDDITSLGWNMYMTPQQASHGLALMQNYPLHVPDLGENNGYRDLTEFTVFNNYKKIW
jgi:GNAT superfamily N-acetyltransferase